MSKGPDSKTAAAPPSPPADRIATTSAPAPDTATAAAAAASPQSGKQPRRQAAPPRSQPRPTKPKPRASTGGAGAGAGAGGASKKGGAKSSAAAGFDDPAKNLKVGDVVLARLKGYPIWPGQIADPDDLPSAVTSSRPSKTAQYFCVQYFPAGDYSWLKPGDISHLSSSQINEWLSATHRQGTGQLRVAYQTASDPAEWTAEQAEKRAAKEEANAGVDELADEDAANTSGKRKRAAGEKKAKAKKAKTDQKKSAVEVEEEENDAPKPKAARATKPEKKAPAAPASAKKEAADDDPLASNPECIKVKDWRHKLQRAFLGKGLPSAQEMDQYDDMFKAIEEYKDITIEALQYSKIGKVMKKIATLNEIPRDKELKITKRANKLMQDWQTFIAANENNANGDSTAKANGNGNADADDKPTGDAVEPVSVSGPSADANAEKKNPPTPPAEEGSKPDQSESDPAVNGTGEGEGDGEKTKMDESA